MKKLVLMVTGLLACVVATTSLGQSQQSQSQSPAPRQPDFRERYQVLSDRNIFLRNRARPPQRNATTNPSTGSSSQASRRPEQSYTLTGIVLEEGRRIAFIENMITGSTERLAVGASIAGGKIADMDFHHLEFETASGERVKVEVGKTLAGSARTSADAIASTQPASDASVPIDPNKPNLTPEEKLKLRRQQEMKR